MLAFSGIFFVLLIGGVRSDPLTCGDTQNIALDPVHVPQFDMDSVIIASNQGCKWNFTYPSDYLADVTVNGESMHYMDSVTLFSHFGSDELYQRILYQGNDANPSSCFAQVMWPQGQFELDVTTIVATQMILTVHVKLVKMVTMTGGMFTTGKDGQPKYIQLQDWPAQKSYTIQSSNLGVSLSNVLPSYTDQTPLANIFLYEEDATGKLIFRGTFHTWFVDQQLQEIKPSGKEITIYRARQDNIVGTVIVNDQDNMKNVNFHSVWSPYNQGSLGYSQSFAIDADSSKGTIGALTVINQATGQNAIYFTGVEYKTDDATPVKLVAGGMVADYMQMGTFLGSYGENASSLPVYLPGFARTFIIEKGSAVVSYTVMPDAAHYSDAINGRTGFLMSDNYPFSSLNQDSKDFELKSLNKDPFTFFYTIKAKNPLPDAYLNVTLWGENGGDINEESNYVIDMNTVTLGDFHYTAKEMIFTIFGGNGISTGTLIPYSIKSTANSIPVDTKTTKIAPPLSSVSQSSTSPALSTSTVSSTTTVGSKVPSSAITSTTVLSSTVSSSTKGVTVPSSTAVSSTTRRSTVSTSSSFPEQKTTSPVPSVSSTFPSSLQSSTIASTVIPLSAVTSPPKGMETTTPSSAGCFVTLLTAAMVSVLMF